MVHELLQNLHLAWICCGPHNHQPHLPMHAKQHAFFERQGQYMSEIHMGDNWDQALHWTWSRTIHCTNLKKFVINAPQHPTTLRLASVKTEEWWLNDPSATEYAWERLFITSTYGDRSMQSFWGLLKSRSYINQACQIEVVAPFLIDDFKIMVSILPLRYEYHAGTDIWYSQLGSILTAMLL